MTKFAPSSVNSLVVLLHQFGFPNDNNNFICYICNCFSEFFKLGDLTNREEVSMKVIPLPSRDNDFQIRLIIR